MPHRVRAVLFLVAAPLLQAASDDPPKVDAMMARYHQVTSAMAPSEQACASGESDEKGSIVVCGRHALEQRVPFPEELGPPDGPRRPTGDPRAALAAEQRSCPPGGCTGVNLFKVPIVLFRIVQKLADPDR